MKILVTGATGLVGNDLVWRLVERGDEVRALVRDPERARKSLPPGVEFVAGDMTNRESLRAAVKGVERVFHTAGIPELSVGDPLIHDRVNRQGTADLLEAALEAGVSRFIHTSSMSTFSAPRSGRMTEDNLQHPKHTAYERSKQAAEREVDAARARGLDTVILNPGGIYGPSPFPNLMNGLFLRIARGQSSKYTTSGGVSVLYVRGCTDAHLAAADRGRSGARYLLADAHHSMLEITREAIRIAGQHVDVKVLPDWVMSGVARIGEFLDRRLRLGAPVTRDSLSFTRWDVRVDSTRAQRELGFRPTPLSEGVAETLRAFATGKRPGLHSVPAL